MIKDITKIVESKINELGFNFNTKELFKKEMISISLNEDDSKYFPTWDCVYYAQSQGEGIFRFQVRFSRENQYLDHIDVNANIHIVLGMQ